MRFVAFLLALACPAFGQFRSTVPLVVAPTTVTDAKGHLVDGLTVRDLVLYDNNVPQALQLDIITKPVSLVVLIQASSNSAAILDKLRSSGVLFSDLLSGEGGDTTLLAFSDTVQTIQDSTSDSSDLSRALKDLRVQGHGVAILDGVWTALRMLADRGTSRRRVILVIAETRDRSSKVELPTVMESTQLQNTAIYWLTYSPFLTAFTNRPKTVWDRETVAQKAEAHKTQGNYKYPYPEETEIVPPDIAPGSLLSIFTEMKRRSDVDLAALLSRSTGGRTFGFLKQSGLESAIQAVGEEVHRQYVLNFQPATGTPGVFHALHVEVKGRPELQARTRAGYWSVQ